MGQLRIEMTGPLCPCGHVEHERLTLALEPSFRTDLKESWRRCTTRGCDCVMHLAGDLGRQLALEALHFGLTGRIRSYHKECK